MLPGLAPLRSSLKAESPEGSGDPCDATNVCSRHLLWDIHELKEARERLTRERNRKPRAVELADALGWNVGRVDETLRAEASGELAR
jgi:DNA-directed RNA polymerase specialized sigma subunit